MIDTVEELQKAVETLHECHAQFAETDEVVELFHGKTVWEGTVFVFDLQGHPKAARAYAWSSPIEGSTKRRYYAVLHVPPVDSPEKAVRASIVADHKK
jgi:hypothetical protein